MPPLYPPERKKMDPKDYERVPVGDFVYGEIEEIQYEAMHEFKGQNAKVDEAVRFKFKIDKLSFPHYSRWMTFSYGEKSNLYIKYLSALVEGAKPDMRFDLTQLKGFRVKMIWLDDPRNPEYQTISLILPEKGKFTAGKESAPVADSDANDEEVPF